MLWENFLNVLKSKISSVSFDTWFKDTKLLKQDNCKLVICSYDFPQKFLNDTYYDLIDEIISGLTGNSYDLEFIVEEEVIEEEKRKKRRNKGFRFKF